MKLFTILALCCLVCYGLAEAATITFDEYPVGTVITNQYAELGVVFSGALGNAPVIANDAAMPTSPVLSPNPIFAGTFYITFISGAYGIEFDSGYWNTVGAGVIQAYDTYGAILATLSNTGTGPEHIDLSGLGTVGKIYFESTRDPAGADIDNLEFTAVPEPSYAILSGTALIIIGLATSLKRRRN